MSCFPHGARSALSILLCVLGAACAEDDLPNADQPEFHDITSAPAAIREAARAVVRIQHPAGTAGTGTFISRDGLLLTNNHVLGAETCAREGCSITLTFDHERGTLSLPGRQFFAVPQHVDVGLDMAVLQVYLDPSEEKRPSTPNFLRFASRTAQELLGQHLTAVGHPLGRLKKWSSGSVIRADGDWFETSIFSLPGGSGSPILNDEGSVVGLLHRGAEGFDLLTSTSSQVTAIATATAALERALEDALPATVISLADPLSAEQARAHSDAFLAASTWEANVDGAPVSLVSLFGAACDESLARDDYTSVEELQAGFRPCFAALDFIECRTDVGEQNEEIPRVCPDDVSSWRARLETVAAIQRDENGALDLASISFSMETLADTQARAEQTARDNIVQALDEYGAPIDFSLAYYLSYYGIASYDRQSTSELVLNYARVPFYERYAWEIAISSLWLYAVDLLDREQALKVVKALYRDPKVSIGAKLRIEEVLYNSDEL